MCCPLLVGRETSPGEAGGYADFSLDLRVPKQAMSPSSLPSLGKDMPARPDRPSEEPGKLNPTVHLLLSLSLPLLGTFTNFRGLKQRGIEKVVKVLSSLGRPLV